MFGHLAFPQNTLQLSRTFPINFAYLKSKRIPNLTSLWINSHSFHCSAINIIEDSSKNVTKVIIKKPHRYTRKFRKVKPSSPVTSPTPSQLFSNRLKSLLFNANNIGNVHEENKCNSKTSLKKEIISTYSESDKNSVGDESAFKNVVFVCDKSRLNTRTIKKSIHEQSLVERRKRSDRYERNKLRFKDYREINFELLKDFPRWLKGLKYKKYAWCFESMNWREIIELDELGLIKRGVYRLVVRRNLLMEFMHIKKVLADINRKGLTIADDSSPVQASSNAISLHASSNPLPVQLSSNTLPIQLSQAITNHQIELDSSSTSSKVDDKENVNLQRNQQSLDDLMSRKEEEATRDVVHDELLSQLYFCLIRHRNQK
ncbi:8254_t:CDS:2 [Acaulospora morrowiae]|uniref:8254_t:CDS:1 n=1 Tax=Acaulospora morrowiae TaxID=94023 RepID=A0A9N9AMD4_9GLOM|nr:8254_t:CDS:2 [Acaulospora morrowiae]